MLKASAEKPPVPTVQPATPVHQRQTPPSPRQAPTPQQVSAGGGGGYRQFQRPFIDGAFEFVSRCFHILVSITCSFQVEFVASVSSVGNNFA